MKRWMDINGKKVKVFQTSDSKRQYHREYHKGRKYGLSKEQFKIMLEDQDNSCLICNILFDEAPHVDHCHKTGKVRGLLCRHCNMLLGFARDNKKTLQSAIHYLKSHEKEAP